MSERSVMWWHRLRAEARDLHGRQQGQTLVIIVLAIVGILAFAGLAIDLAMVYAERVKVARAADAAALAAAAELAMEPAAHDRALVYLEENGYDWAAPDTRVVIDGLASGAAPEDAMTTIWIDTKYSRDGGAPDTADRITVRVQRQVWMTFMQFIGFRYFPVEATAEAENVINIDTVIVYDTSGSMEFETRCYGCWVTDTNKIYPSGNIYPLHWSDTTTTTADHCAGWSWTGGYADGLNCGGYYTYTSRAGTTYEDYENNSCNYHKRPDTGAGSDDYYIVIEAEDYSSFNVPYDKDSIENYETYWVMQRNDYNFYYERPVEAMGRDARGAYISHHPYYTGQGGWGLNCTWSSVSTSGKCQWNRFQTPVASYDFYAPVSGDYYFWIRGQGGESNSANHIFWRVDGDWNKGGQEDGFQRTETIQYDGAVNRYCTNYDYYHHVCNTWVDAWTWRILSKGSSGAYGDDVYLDAGTHTLELWAGGTGFDVDRLVVTTDGDSPSSPVIGFDPNDGRTRRACDPCDERYAGRPGGVVPDPPTYNAYRPHCTYADMTTHDLYDDEQPIRDALEAAKFFVGMLDPKFDQIGYVPYSTRANIASELQCLRRQASSGVPCTPQVITDTVITALDATRAGGSTNIAEGIKLGLEVLSTGSCNASNGYDECGRPGAAKVMVLMTDGEANTISGCDGACDDDSTLYLVDEMPEKDCVMYYANEARREGVVIYTIALGKGADANLMAAVADRTGGIYEPAQSKKELLETFEEFYKQIFLRLVE